MLAPYLRLAVIHLMFIALFIPVALIGRLLGTITPALAALMAVKVCLDVRAHWQAHDGKTISERLTISLR